MLCSEAAVEDDLEIMIEEARMTVVTVTMIPSLLYRCDQVWSLTKPQQVRVQTTQMSAPRRIQGVNRMDRVRSKDINQQLGILDLIKRRQENWKTSED